NITPASDSPMSVFAEASLLGVTWLFRSFGRTCAPWDSLSDLGVQAQPAVVAITKTASQPPKERRSRIPVGNMATFFL
ncbi:MAG TPA: hypothetical protein VGZ25_09690, partial [Gemmataceae bacterium]|nr:hypothetical protein [Gemmataceae bacterium]